jgi:hypothetical protein
MQPIHLTYESPTWSFFELYCSHNGSLKNKPFVIPIEQTCKVTDPARPGNHYQKIHPAYLSKIRPRNMVL